MVDLLTTRQVGIELGEPEWTVRRAVDRLTPPVVRFGLKRAIPRERIEEIRREIDASRQLRKRTGNA